LNSGSDQTTNTPKQKSRPTTKLPDLKWSDDNFVTEDSRLTTRTCQVRLFQVQARWKIFVFLSDEGQDYKS